MKLHNANLETIKEAALMIKDKVGSEYDFAMDKILETLEVMMPEEEFITFCEEL